MKKPFKMKQEYPSKFYKKDNMAKFAKVIGITPLALLNIKQGAVSGRQNEAEYKKNMYFFMMKGWNAYCDEIHAVKD